MNDTSSSAESVTRVPVAEFAAQISLEPLNGRISFFSYQGLEDEQKRQFLREPIAAVPASLFDRLPPLRLVLVPFLEKGHSGGPDQVSLERPNTQRILSRSNLAAEDALFLFLATEQQEVADYHYWFFNGVAEPAAERMEASEFDRFSALIGDELNRTARGEVDEQSFLLKQKLSRQKRLPGSDTKMMREYVQQALEDTLTLYLHGLCCDIDVEPGPRQLSTRYLRRRLELLAEIFPPNPGCLLFPSETHPTQESPAD